MKRTINPLTLLSVALCLLFMASCHNDELSSEQSYIPQDGVIRVATTVANTRAGMTTQNLNSFYMKVVHPTDSRYSYYADMLKRNDAWCSYVPTATGAPPELPMFWKNGHDKITVGAICTPGLFRPESIFNSLHSYYISSDQNSYEYSVKECDILYMPPTEVDPATGKGLVDGKIKVELVHLFSKLNLSITMGTEFNVNNGTAVNPIAQLAVDGTKYRVYFNASTNVWGEVHGNVTPISPWHESTNYVPGQGETQKAQAFYESILIPQTVAAGVFSVNMTIDGREFMWTSKKDITFESGKQYNLSLNVGKDITIIGDMSVSDWENGTGGSIETE